MLETSMADGGSRIAESEEEEDNVWNLLTLQHLEQVQCPMRKKIQREKSIFFKNWTILIIYSRRNGFIHNILKISIAIIQ